MPNLFEPDGGLQLERMVRQARTGVPVRNVELTLIRDGETRQTAWNVDEVAQASGFIFVGNDVTHQRQADLRRAQLEKEIHAIRQHQAIGQLARGVAHDVNNMLAGILSQAEIAELHDPSPEIAESLQKIERMVERGAEIVQQLLQASRREAAGEHSTSVSEAAEAALEVIRASIPKEIDISVDIEPGIGNINAPEGQIDQILINLTSNAVRAMQETATRRLRIEVGRESGDRDRSFAGFRVTDTGVGMSSETLGRVFEPYFTTSVDGSGTGLGVSLVKQVAESLGGTVEARSELGVGTEFRVRIPLSEPFGGPHSPEERDDPGRDPTSDSRVGSGRARILFVEDEDALRLSTEEILEAAGFSTTSFARPTEALEYFESRPAMFDILFTDHSLPEMSGLELISAVKQIRSDLPAVLWTGYGREVGPLDDRGVSELLAKPVKGEAVVDAIERVLKLAAGSPRADVRRPG